MLRAKCGYGHKRKSKTQRNRKHSNERPTSRESVQLSMQMAGMEWSPAQERAYQMAGMGCSMSGETELKLALARRDNTASAGDTTVDTNELGRMSSKPGKAMRRLREMVSKTF